MFTDPGANNIGRMTPKGLLTVFPINNCNPSPRGVTRGPDGTVWYVEYFDGYIGRVTPQGTITRFPIPEDREAANGRLRPGRTGTYGSSN